MKNGLIILSVFFLFTCKKKDGPGTVPYVPVNLTIYLSDPSHFNLNFIGGYEYVIGGSRGIILYRFTQDQIVAFDRHCTYDLNDACGVLSADANGFLLQDNCCESKFLITNGSIYSGPAPYPLLQYRTDLQDNVLRVYN